MVDAERRARVAARQHQAYVARKALDPERHRAKAREIASRWRARNPLYRQNYYAMKRFGITAPELAAAAERMFREQGGACATCGDKGDVVGLVAKAGAVRLVVDHDHKTGRLRALLCDACNTAFGKLKECPERIAGLLSYARKARGEP